MVNSPDEFGPSDADDILSGADFAKEQAANASQDSAATQDVQQLQQQLTDAHDRLLRTQAEMENIRRRSQRDMQEGRRFANQALLVDLLPVLDNMERAIDAAQQSPEGGGLLEGFKMLHQLLLSTFEKHHCRPVPAAGADFDPALHQAVLQTPSDDFAAGAVTQVHQQGYQLHDRVIRPAQVVVSSGSASGGNESSE